MEAASSLQQSCQFSSQGFILHGRFSKSGRCETNPSLVQDQLRVHTSLRRIKVSIPCERVETSRTKIRSIFLYKCPDQRTVIQCFKRVNLTLSADSCRGTVESIEKETFICNTFERKINDTWFGECRQAFNLNLVHDYWTKSSNLTSINLVEIIGGTSVLIQKEQVVKYIEKR